MLPVFLNLYCICGKTWTFCGKNVTIATASLINELKSIESGESHVRRETKKSDRNK